MIKNRAFAVNMFVSIISGSTPLAGEPFGLSNRMTAKSLDAIGSVGGPRCCKRDSYEWLPKFPKDPLKGWSTGTRKI